MPRFGASAALGRDPPRRTAASRERQQHGSLSRKPPLPRAAAARGVQPRDRPPPGPVGPRDVRAVARAGTEARGRPRGGARLRVLRSDAVAREPPEPSDRGSVDAAPVAVLAPVPGGEARPLVRGRRGRGGPPDSRGFSGADRADVCSSRSLESACRSLGVFQNEARRALRRPGPGRGRSRRRADPADAPAPEAHGERSRARLRVGVGVVPRPHARSRARPSGLVRTSRRAQRCGLLGSNARRPGLSVRPQPHVRHGSRPSRDPRLWVAATGPARPSRSAVSWPSSPAARSFSRSADTCRDSPPSWPRSRSPSSGTP